MFQSNIKRRQFLQGIGAGVATASLGGCVSLPKKDTFKRPYSRLPLVAPKIDRKNIVTEVVGHRPYRAKGFVVRKEPFGSKTLVHNYGHGGGGISLSWGSAALAVNEVANMTSIGRKQAAVIGGGVMGLSTARLLQDAGWAVTIYTREMAQHTTSRVAGGEWGPYSVHDPLVSSDAFKQQLQIAAKIAHQTFAKMVSHDYGIEWKELYTASDKRPDSHGPFHQYYPFSQLYGPNEHPFPTEYCTVSATMLVETGTYLRRLIEEFQLAGGEFVIRDFQHQDELQGLNEPVIFNCTGLGSRTLFGDQDIVPAKGQLILLPPDPAVDYLTVGGGTGSLYMFSRSDYMILGGTFGLNDWSTEPDPLETERILQESQQFFANLA
jgi:glycine/D-amino acid oxidase-like deaminating enzyme